MGNNTSSTSSNTPNWKTYQVQRIERNPYSIKFFLNNNVEYSNTYAKYIHCENSYPYNGVRAGEFIQVNQRRSEDYNSSHKFTFDDNLRVVRVFEMAREYSLAPAYALFLRTGMMNYRRYVEWQGSTEIEYIRYETVEQGEVFAHQIATKYNW